jgi:hypothetical protein
VCKSAYHRDGSAEALSTDRGQVAEGLEAWLAGREGLPEVLMASARSLAAEVDAGPRNSPLWARYAEVLRLLLEHDDEINSSRTIAAQEHLFGLFRDVHEATAYSATRAREATSPEEAARWTDWVPRACAEGRHRRYDWPAGKTTCLDCQVELPRLGVV